MEIYREGDLSRDYKGETLRQGSQVLFLVLPLVH